MNPQSAAAAAVEKTNGGEIRCVLFDFDGTLADTAPDMVGALNDWRTARAHPPADVAQMRLLCSGGVRALLTTTGWEGETFEAARADYLRHYENTNYQKTVLFAGTKDLLAATKDKLQWGVVTNKPRRYFAVIAEQMQLAALGAGCLICGDDFPQAKPDPTSLLAAAAQCGVSPENCVYVGDDIRDGQAAAAAKMRFVAVTWGYWQPHQWQVDNAPPIELFAATPKALSAWLFSSIYTAVQ